MRLYWTVHTQWYWDTFFSLCEGTPNYKKAWEATEELHFEKFGFYKYQEYETFRVAKSQRLNKGKPKTDPNQLSLWAIDS